MIVRRTADDCLNCGSQIPNSLERIKDLDYFEYRCPDCGRTILSGVVTENGAPGERRTPRHDNDPEPAIRESVTWATWEKWWTNEQIVSMIHGRVVAGEKELARFVEKLEKIYERTRTST